MATKKPSPKKVAKPKVEKKVVKKEKTPKKNLQELLPLDHLALYSKDCKRCGYLDPEEKKKFKQCHFSKGNTLCPASEVRIVVVGKATSYAEQVRKARDEQNPQKEAKLMAYVAKQTIAFQSKFYSVLENDSWQRAPSPLRKRGPRRVG